MLVSLSSSSSSSASSASGTCRMHADSIRFREPRNPKVSVVLFDSCATRCFEKDVTNGVPGTFMELIVKPIVRQASTTTNGDGLMLMRYNFVVEVGSCDSRSFHWQMQ